MVFHASDSTNTLVSLDNGIKIPEQCPAEQQHQKETFVRTELLVENSQCLNDDADHDDVNVVSQHRSLYLPDDTNANLDEYLPAVASLRESCEELLLQPVRQFDASSRERVLYVQQGERANATASYCDVLMSDKATTCHILALYSHGEDASATPLASLTHLDGTSYEACIRDMIQEHLLYHHQQQQGEEEKKCNDEAITSKVTIDIHIMGGFNDADGTSADITNWLLRLLAQITNEYQHLCKMLLKTCAVTSMNDTGYAGPIGRGMGICLKTGDVFLARCDAAVAGPVPVLRSIRLWSKSHASQQRLTRIHDATSSSSCSKLIVEPFLFSKFDDVSFLLTLHDDVLLQYTSTSPDVEEPDFCTCIRASLQFMQQQCCYKVFGRNMDQPLVFERVGNNGWKQVPF